MEISRGSNPGEISDLKVSEYTFIFYRSKILTACWPTFCNWPGLGCTSNWFDVGRWIGYQRINSCEKRKQLGLFSYPLYTISFNCNNLKNIYQYFFNKL